MNTALVNLLGFAVGVALYALLLSMVLRNRRKDKRIDLLLLTAVLGITWNLSELLSFIWRDFAQNEVSPFLSAVSYSALGFLPSVVVHSAEDENKNSRLLTIMAYCLSTFAALLHFKNAFTNGDLPSNLALQLLTFGSIALLAGLLLFNFRKELKNKTVWIAALLVFALSALHLSSTSEGVNWVVELIGHQSSLPLVLAILVQDYRFAFADLFLKRALSLLLLALSALSLYIFVAQPLSYLHASHDENDPLTIAILLILWIVTALVYPFLHKFSVWLVDKILLKRVSYTDLQKVIYQEVEKHQSFNSVLDLVSEKMREALTVEKFSWREIYQESHPKNHPIVEFTRQKAEVFIPTNEPPSYRISLDNFLGGRKLLSEEVEMLEAVSLLTARKIDALRVVKARVDQETREQEYTKLTAEAQLTALRSQMNPHFLFNALTTIGHLIQTTPEKAFQTLMKLTQLLRAVLKSGGDFCTLGEELKLIENYLDIERARFEERLLVEIKVPKELHMMQVPSLILQPLVENAVKHGISKNKDGGTVRIVAELDKVGSAAFLNLSVCDTGAGKRVFDGSDSSGIGLNNVRGRLKSHYGEKASFKIVTNEENQTEACIKLPIK